MDLVADPDLEAAIEDVEELVLAGVNVRRRAASGAGEVLHEDELPVAALGGGLERHRVADDPDSLALAGGDGVARRRCLCKWSPWGHAPRGTPSVPLHSLLETVGLLNVSERRPAPPRLRSGGRPGLDLRPRRARSATRSRPSRSSSRPLSERSVPRSSTARSARCGPPTPGPCSARASRACSTALGGAEAAARRPSRRREPTAPRGLHQRPVFVRADRGARPPSRARRHRRAGASARDRRRPSSACAPATPTSRWSTTCRAFAVPETSGLNRRRLLVDHLHVLVPAGHPLARRETVGISEPRSGAPRPAAARHSCRALSLVVRAPLRAGRVRAAGGI